jgi:hypothetical protein
LEYAVADESVTFEQRYTLSVDGEWVGRVTKLAIGQNLDEEELLVFHCTDEWDVVGVAAGYKTVEEAKERLERSYHGLASKWQVAGYSRGEAEAHVAEQFKGQECSFCGRTPLQFQSSVAGDTVRVCNRCIDEFYGLMHSEASEP